MQTRQRTISYTRRQRLLVRRLVELLAHRQEVQERLDREHAEGVAAAREACEQRTRDLTDLRDHAVYTAEQERQGALSSVRPPREEELGQAREKMDAEISAFAARSNSMLKVAGERLEEAKWLAETLVESGQSAARARFEAVQRVIQKRVSELEQMRKAAAAMLTQGRYGGFGDLEEAQGDGSEAPTADVPVQRLLEELERDCAVAGEAVELLHRRAHPAMLSVAGIFSGAAAVGGAAALWMMVQAVDPEPRVVGQAAAMGFAVGLVVMIVARLGARQRVPAAAAKCGAAIGHAMATARRSLAQATAERERDVRAAQARAGQELREAQAQYTKVRREVDRRREVEAPQLREHHQGIVKAIQARLDAAVEEIDGVYRQRTQEAQERWKAGVEEAEQERDQRIGDLDAAHESGWRALVEHWQTTMEELEAEYTALRSRAQALWPAWDALLGRDALEDLPPAARFAGLEVDLRGLPGGVPEDARLPLTIPERFELAATLDLLGHGSLLLEHPPEARAKAIAALNAAMLRLLTTFPPGKVRFTILDPVGLGESFAAFMHLADHEPALVSDRIWTDQRHIEQKLADLTEHMETVIQKYLRNEYESIQDYNAEAGEIAEPFRFLVIADFPANFSEAAMKRLSSILSSGSRCGVFTLIATDTSGGVDAGLRVRGGSSRLPHWIPMEDVRRAGNTLTWHARDDGDAGGFVWEDDDFGRFALRMEDLPDADLLTRLLHEAGRRARDSSRVQVPFGSVAPGMEAIWSRSAATELEVPLGRSGARKVQELSLGRGTTQHALIAGRTGSGKSNLLHVLITNVALWYSPSEVELYLVDFKKGVEFKTYAVHQLPHARVVAIESEREFGLSVLRRLDAELTRRGTLFRDAGGGRGAGHCDVPAGNGEGAAPHCTDRGRVSGVFRRG